MTKAHILNIEGKSVKEIAMPWFFQEEFREDLILKVLETKKTKQPYSPSAVAGRQHSASGILVHRRHVWKSQYGKGMSRIPRKSLWRRGTQFNWVGATSPNTRGGRRAHPPKVVSMINTKKINKKELEKAFFSALGAVSNPKLISLKYSRVTPEEVKRAPFIVESKILQLKAREFLKSLRNILGENLYQVAIRTKKTRAGKGKMRGRRYKKNEGLLLVIGKEENYKTSAIEVIKTKDLSVLNLAKGGARLVIFTEEAIKELEKRK